MQQHKIIFCFFCSIITAAVSAHNCPHFGKVLLEHARATDNSQHPLKKVSVEQEPAVSLPESFGKTHFIVGASTAQVKEEFQQMPAAVTSSSTTVPTTNENFIAQAFFSPDNGLEKKLIELIEHEQDSMKIAVFIITNGNIAQALIEAQKRGINIEVITDSSCLQDKFNKINMLHDAGIKIRIYKPETAVTVLSNRMHHKFIIFGKNKDGKRWLWFGSFNLTKSADLYNQEGVILIDNNQLIDQFDKQFDVLKQRSIGYQKAMSPLTMTAGVTTGPKHLKRISKKTRIDKRNDLRTV